MRHVVIGAGPAGVRAAETLREHDPGASVTLVSGEPGPPYARMAIPYILSGRIGGDGAVQRRNPDHFAERSIRYLNRRALQVRAGPDGGTVECDDGSRLDYDRLLVATGSSPTLPGIPGTDLPGVVTRVLMVGAGFVAGVCMKSLLDRGVKLTVIAGRSGQILRSMMTPAGSRLLQRWLEERGVEVVSHAQIERIEPGPRLVARERTFAADLVILATGVHPNVAFLDGTGAHVDQGIVVDDRMRTTVPQVYAAGDVAQGRDFSTGEWVVHALQPTATEHGRVAALNMAGQDAPYRGSLGMNVLDTAGLISETFGRWQGVPGGETAESLDEAAYYYTRLCFEGDTLVGAIGIGPGRSLGPIRGLIQTRRHLGAWKERLLQDPARVTEAFVDTET